MLTGCSTRVYIYIYTVISLYASLFPGNIVSIVDSSSTRALSEESNSAGSCFSLSFPRTGLSISGGGLPLDVSSNQSQIRLSLSQPQPASRGLPSGVDTSSQPTGRELPSVSSTLTQPTLTQPQPASRGLPSGVDTSSEPLTTTSQQPTTWGRGLPSLIQPQLANSGLPSIISDSHEVIGTGSPTSSSALLPPTNTDGLQNLIGVHLAATPQASPLKQIDPSGKLVGVHVVIAVGLLVLLGVGYGGTLPAITNVRPIQSLQSGSKRNTSRQVCMWEA